MFRCFLLLSWKKQKTSEQIPVLAAIREKRVGQVERKWPYQWFDVFCCFRGHSRKQANNYQFWPQPARNGSDRLNESGRANVSMFLLFPCRQQKPSEQIPVLAATREKRTGQVERKWPRECFHVFWCFRGNSRKQANKCQFWPQPARNGSDRLNESGRTSVSMFSGVFVETAETKRTNTSSGRNQQETDRTG